MDAPFRPSPADALKGARRVAASSSPSTSETGHATAMRARCAAAPSLISLAAADRSAVVLADAAGSAASRSATGLESTDSDRAARSSPVDATDDADDADEPSAAAALIGSRSADRSPASATGSETGRTAAPPRSFPALSAGVSVRASA